MCKKPKKSVKKKILRIFTTPKILMFSFSYVLHGAIFW